MKKNLIILTVLCLINCCLVLLMLKYGSQNYLVGSQTNEIADFEEATMTEDETVQKQKLEARKKEEELNKRREERIKQHQEHNQNLGEKLGVNPLAYLSGKPKSAIYRLRKKYVAQSLFANPNYQPSEAVFGGIVDGKPWINANPCSIDGSKRQGTNGFSEESRFITNPNMLVAIEYPFSFSNQPNNWCEDSINQLVPKEINYSKENNEIIVVYNQLPFMAPVGNKWFYVFNGLNARDLGYKYAYVDNSKSTYKPHYTDTTNISNSVVEFQNYIHLGGSCGYESGCNNGSPRQTYLEFQDNFTEYKYRNREIYIKLWKNRPASKNSPADITERIVLRWS